MNMNMVGPLFKALCRGTRIQLQFRRWSFIFQVLAAILLCFSAHAALQFDVFAGYDGVIPEASWFPVVCEIKNDGPSFNGIIELTPGGAGYQGQTRKVAVELPTGTLKRLTIPVFSNSRGMASWDLRL